MPDALDEQIRAYRRMLPSIRQEHGSVWALVAHGKLVQTFLEFAAAARYAEGEEGLGQVLIRHTDEAEESAPFIHVTS